MSVESPGLKSRSPSCWKLPKKKVGCSRWYGAAMQAARRVAPPPRAGTAASGRVNGLRTSGVSGGLQVSRREQRGPQKRTQLQGSAFVWVGVCYDLPCKRRLQPTQRATSAKMHFALPASRPRRIAMNVSPSGVVHGGGCATSPVTRRRQPRRSAVAGSVARPPAGRAPTRRGRRRWRRHGGRDAAAGHPVPHARDSSPAASHPA